MRRQGPVLLGYFLGQFPTDNSVPPAASGGMATVVKEIGLSPACTSECHLRRILPAPRIGPWCLRSHTSLVPAIT